MRKRNFNEICAVLEKQFEKQFELTTCGSVSDAETRAGPIVLIIILDRPRVLYTEVQLK